MKKTKRIIAILLTAVICLAMCGCAPSQSDIEQMRSTHGVWMTSDRTSIKLNGEEFKQLPVCSTLTPSSINLYRTAYITDADVPLLLCEFMGEAYEYSDDGYFLYTYDPSASYEGAYITYCRTDRYDSVLQQINDGPQLNGYCYEYNEYSDEDVTTKIYTLSETETEAVNAVLATEGTVIPDSTLNYDYSLYMEKCSDDTLFRDYAFELCVIESKYFFVNYGDTEVYLHEVPESMSDTFAQIMSKYIESEHYWYSEDDYYYEYEYLDEEGYEL